MIKVKRAKEGGAKGPKPKNWYSDKYQTVFVQRNILAVFTLISLLVALVSVFAVQRLAPLKSIEPFVVQVDEKLGITEVVEPVVRDEIRDVEVLDNFFIWQFIRAYETYDVSDNAHNRQIVRVMSNAEVFKVYNEDSSAQNSESAEVRLGAFGVRGVTDPVVTYLEKGENNVVQVRFVALERQESAKPFAYHKIATMSYKYFENMELTREERLINPLGFQIQSYRVDDNIITAR